MVAVGVMLGIVLMSGLCYAIRCVVVGLTGMFGCVTETMADEVERLEAESEEAELKGELVRGVRFIELGEGEEA